MPLQPGYILNNRYRIVNLLGQGGFGAVYRAWDMSLTIPCALKENLGPSEASRQFEREARILANLAHPNLPRVVDYFLVPAKGQYLVMDLVEGKDLQELVEEQQGPIAESLAIGWILQAADALVYLHNQNPPIIHRDIKPANIILSQSGNIYLVDFGLSKMHDPSVKTTLSAYGVSPGYSPQEQYGRGKTDVRTDIYALGATLYCLLTGTEPPESVQRNLGSVLTPPRALNLAISPLVEHAVLKAMEMQPAKRFQSVTAFKSALTGVSQRSARLFVPSVSPRSYSSVNQAAHELHPVKFPRVLWIGLISSVVILFLFFGLSLLRQNIPISEDNTIHTLTEETSLTNSELLDEKRTGTQPTNSSELDSQTGINLLPRIYIIKQGDTCSELADQFGLTTEDIRETNNLPGNCDQLFSGQKLLIPVEADINLDTLPPLEMDPIAVGTSQISEKDGMVSVYVPAGVFWRGSTEFEPQGNPDERPQRALYLDAFWIDKTEVSNAMFAACVREGACETPENTSSHRNLSYFGKEAFADYPVIYVSWTGANQYCQWAGRRLPTEAEWEKAARGTDGRVYPWGNGAASNQLANYDNQIGDTTPVGAYPEGASPYGAFDMAGNVAEWVADWFSSGYYFSTSVINPLGPTQGEFRVHRGGSWLSQAHAIRAAHRLWNYPQSIFEGVGFRCASIIQGDDG